MNFIFNIYSYELLKKNNLVYLSFKKENGKCFSIHMPKLEAENEIFRQKNQTKLLEFGENLN